VAVLPLYGPIAQRMNLMSEVSGGTSAQQFGAMFVQAMNDPEVASIVIDMDSPGGSVFGIQELWDTMTAHRGQKPVTVVANSMAASAAYWIATAAESISVTPGGTVGSIGVIMEHTDISQALEMVGIKPTLITAGKKKGSGNPYAPLSEESLADFQAKVNTYYGMFVSAVAKGRGVSLAQVRNGFGEGDIVLAQEAKRLGMVDRIETLDQAIARMMGRATGTRATGTAIAKWVIAQVEDAELTAVMPTPVPEPEPEPEPVPANAQLLAARRRGFI
jgi:signal peptide peptidase SppA